ncbi:hypothetical protein ACLOJK_041332 [Asimina triloba]
MSLTRVKMLEEFWLICIAHALSTETEEIIGLILGDIKISMPLTNINLSISRISDKNRIPSDDIPLPWALIEDILNNNILRKSKFHIMGHTL